MKKKIVLVRTNQGQQYAGIIADKLKALGVECEITGWDDIEAFLEQNSCTPESTLLHYRAAGINANPGAFRLEKMGYRLINPARVLDRTSDKYKSFEWAREHGTALPVTNKGTPKEIKNSIDRLTFNEFVLKPINSKSQGALCFRSYVGDPEIDEKISQVPGDEIILQELVDYQKIYRVIVIGNKVLEKAVFYDEPTAERWKVSVCLNPEIKHEKNPDPELLSYAKKLAEIFESEIAFIDVFQTDNGYVLSEINTACNLTQHEEKSGYDISGDIAKYLVSQIDKEL